MKRKGREGERERERERDQLVRNKIIKIFLIQFSAAACRGRGMWIW
jgi:hypothetical protein